MSQLIDKIELLRIIKNGGNYNSDCPEWVIDVINNMSITIDEQHKEQNILEN